MSLTINSRLKARINAAFINFVASAVILCMLAIVIIFLWYPSPYGELSGKRRLLEILFGVNFICGPFLTFIFCDPIKSKKELFFDKSIIIVIQFCALIYGLYSIGMARPVVLAFEYDRYVVVTAAQVERSMLSDAKPQFKDLPWNGPMLLSTRSPEGTKELVKSLDLSLQGVQPSSLPSWWKDYEEDVEKVTLRMHNLNVLWSKLTENEKNKITPVIEKTGLGLSDIYYLPLVSEKILDQWSILLNENGKIVGTAKINGFQ